MLNNQPFDSADAMMDGLTREKLLQAFSILGIPVGDENTNSRGEVIDALSVEDLNSPEYWNDKKPGPTRGVRPPLYSPEFHEDSANDVILEQKTDWDVQGNESGF